MMITTRREAQAKDENKYFTGRPCPRGHLDLRYTSTGGCRTCCKANFAIYYKNHKAVVHTAKRQWVKANPAKVKVHEKTKTEKRKAWLDLFKAQPCKDCKQVFPPYVMDFDHIRDKSFQIGARRHFSKTKLLAEIAKCEVVCANCHRIRTAKRRAERLGNELLERKPRTI